MQQLINALSLGAIYSLIALGYSLVFSVLRMINLAHCDIMMIGAYVGYICSVYFNMGFLLSVVFSVIICSIIGILVEKFAYRALHGVSGMPVMVVAIGVSILMEYICMFIFGADAKTYPAGFLGGVINIGGYTIPVSRLICLGLALVLVVLLELLLSKTKHGRAMRAVADDEVAARLCGVNEEATTRIAFCIGSALAGVAGVIYGAMYIVSPFMGTIPGIKAFVAAVVGGIGNVAGAVLGGFALGMAETFAGTMIHSAFKDVTAFIILIIILLLKPGGITGAKNGSDRL